MNDLTIAQLSKMIMKHWLFIAVCSVISAVALFLVSKYAIEPKYSSVSSAYVFNRNIVNTGQEINQNDLNVSVKLISTYSVILKNHDFLKKVKEESGVDYGVGTIAKMISMEAEGSTWVMKITVTCNDPYKAFAINTAIQNNAYEEIQKIMDGGYFKTVNSPTQSKYPISPNKTRNTLYGFIIGIIVGILYAVLKEILDTTINTEEDVTTRFEIPIIGSIPNWNDVNDKKYVQSYEVKSDEKK